MSGRGMRRAAGLGAAALVLALVAATTGVAAGGSVAGAAASFSELAGPTVPLHDPDWLSSPGWDADVHLFDATPDGRYFAYWTDDVTPVGPASGPGRYSSVIVRDMSTGTIQVVWSYGVPNSSAPVVSDVHISDDGRWLSIVGHLGLDPARPDQPSGGPQLYVIDLLSGAARLASRVPDGSTGSSGSVTWADMDGTGRYVYFVGAGSDFVAPIAGQPVTGPQLYRYDRVADRVDLVSGAGAAAPNGYVASTPAVTVSGDGQVAAFASTSTNLVSAGPGSGLDGWFVRDMSSATTTAIVTPDGGSIGFFEGRLSRDGSRFAFTSTAHDLGFIPAGPAVATPAVYVWKRSNRTFSLASPSLSSPTKGADGGAQLLDISDDGTVIAMGAGGNDLVPGVVDTNSWADVYVRNTGTGTTKLITSTQLSPTTTSNAAADDVHLSGDGRVIAAATGSTDEVAGARWNQYHMPVVTEVASGARKYLTSPWPGGPVGAAFIDVSWLSQDGTRAAFDVGGGGSGHVDVADVEPGRVTESSFVPLSPSRLLDTRTGLGDERPGSSGIAMGPGEEVHLQVGGRGGVPSRDVSAVVVNVTSVEALQAGYVAVRPATAEPTYQWGASPVCYRPVGHVCVPIWRPVTTSNLNVDGPGRIIANQVTVPVGPGGRISLASTAGGHLIVDVLGYDVVAPTGSATAGRFVGQTPSRILDTRDGLGLGHRLSAGETARLAVAGHGGVPVSGASAVVLNLTLVGTGGPGFVTVWPSGLVRPTASNVNADRTGQVRPNVVTVPLGVDGSIDLLVSSGSDVVADVLGWYTDSSASSSGSGLFVPVAPSRFLDTRDPAMGGPSPISAGATLTRSPAVGGVPTSASAVVTNLTLTETSGPGYLTAYPAGASRPVASNLNAESPAQTIANQAIVRGGVGGALSFFPSMRTHLVGDVSGWFTS